VKDAVFRIAMNHINNKVLREDSFKKVLLQGLNEIRTNKIKNNSDLIEYFKAAGYSVKDFDNYLARFVKSEPKNDKDKELLVSIAIYLGDNEKSRNLGLLKHSWWERNLSDHYVKNNIKEKLWLLFRKEDWIKRNTISK